MAKKERLFRFKKFGVRHATSSMPVGVDGVLVAAWAFPIAMDSAPQRILDVGTGCGLIALIAAQRCPEASVTAIDIDAPSIEEAVGNFAASPWASRLQAVNSSLADFAANKISRSANSGKTADILSINGSYDFIVSNPPFFRSGIDDPDSPRLRARHESSLPLEDLAVRSVRLLSEGGHLAVILPYLEVADYFIEQCARVGLSLEARTDVRCFAHSPLKRSLLLFVRGEALAPRRDILIMEQTPQQPTDTYRLLCADLYLRF